MSGVFRNIEPSPPGEWCGGRTHSLGGEGVGGSIFRKTPDTALYSILCGMISWLRYSEWGKTERSSVQQSSPRKESHQYIKNMPKIQTPLHYCLGDVRGTPGRCGPAMHDPRPARILLGGGRPTEHPIARHVTVWSQVKEDGPVTGSCMVLL